MGWLIAASAAGRSGAFGGAVPPQPTLRGAWGEVGKLGDLLFYFQIFLLKTLRGLI